MARGFRNIKRHVPSAHSEEKESSWVSYTDLMSALLIIFALVIMITMYDTQSAYEQQKQVMDQAAQNIKQKEEVIKQKNQLIEEVIGVKSRIIQELVKAFQDSKLNLEVDQQTGAIRFSGGVFFDKKSSTVSSNGEEYLIQFIPQYISILLSDQFKDEIAQIIVEGHTDTDGGYLYNLKLSQDRALSVVQKVFDPTFPKFDHQDELQKVITANGRSFSVPILDRDGKINLEKSRRVEFKFRLKDEQLLDKLQGLMQADGQ
ncbi:OmpA family protein [Paenibacillus sp. ATY16]|uniref:OmpA family protein n=1 Tax=Paenibacillus sp. ATY16 TaxID=1759312 RepID=UPI00200BF72D|nr:OmpA family protein [Paenibacillus sp. ATY16]MCK9858312.1 OmpA family protein [Paenibacillus sp. ATY16]